MRSFLRIAGFALLNVAAGVLLVVAVSMGTGAGPDARSLRDLERDLKRQFQNSYGLVDMAVRFRDGPRPGDVCLSVKFAVPAALYNDRSKLGALVDKVHRRAVLDYMGHAGGVYVEAEPPPDLLLLGGLPRSYSSYRSLGETLDDIRGADLLAYGARRWGVADVSDRWAMVVIHHSATLGGSAASFDRYHREVRGWQGGLAYHFVIGNGQGVPDGLVEVGPRWKSQSDGAHAGVSEANRFGIGICVVGDFTATRPTDRQMSSLRTLLRWLHLSCGIPYAEVCGHSALKDTECPGAQFPMDELIQWLKDDELGRMGLGDR